MSDKQKDEDLKVPEGMEENKKDKKKNKTLVFTLAGGVFLLVLVSFFTGNRGVQLPETANRESAQGFNELEDNSLVRDTENFQRQLTEPRVNEEPRRQRAQVRDEPANNGFFRNRGQTNRRNGPTDEEALIEDILWSDMEMTTTRKSVPNNRTPSAQNGVQNPASERASQTQADANAAISASQRRIQRLRQQLNNLENNQ
jgi:hypothetical protein